MNNALGWLVAGSSIQKKVEVSSMKHFILRRRLLKFKGAGSRALDGDLLWLWGLDLPSLSRCWLGKSQEVRLFQCKERVVKSPEFSPC